MLGVDTNVIIRCSAFSALLDTADLTFEDEPTVETAIYSWKDSASHEGAIALGPGRDYLNVRWTRVGAVRNPDRR
jgi:hypothetical protein